MAAQAVQEGLVSVLKTYLGKPDSGVQLGAYVAVAVLVGTVVMQSMAALLRFSNRGFGRSLLVVLMNFAVVTMAVTAVTVFVVPRISNPRVCMVLPAVTALLVFLVVSAPLVLLIQRGKYGSSFFASLLSLAGALAVVLLIQSAVQAFSKGEKQFSKSRDRLDAAEEVMGGAKK